ncbi:MAG: YARHG domain-containing protein [Lachnospiraceae bacterium]|nr:YARHG domain-containing protein [Lachnospiraceae bacterium]
MGFGKKKEKKQSRKQAKNYQKSVAQKVDNKHNPLYPPRKESLLAEMMSALGVTAVCIVLIGVIVSRFSLTSRVYASESTYEPQVVEDFTEDMETDAYGTSSGTEEIADVYESEAEVSEEELPEKETAVIESLTESKEESLTETDGDSQMEDLTDRDYIIADSDSRYVTKSELAELTAEELRYARNEIYARHGRKFKDDALQSYFDSKDWYTGTIEPDDFTDDMLNEYEKMNAKTILDYESEMAE